MKKKILNNSSKGRKETSDDEDSVTFVDTTGDVERSINSGGADEEAVIRVGEEFQTVIPEFREGSRCFKEDFGVALWKPTSKLSEDQLKTFIDLADKRWLIGEEKALSLLFFREHNLEIAKQDCRNFAPRPSDWFEEEELLFSKALQLESKRFPRIQRWLGNRSVADLVEHYYRIHKPKMLREKRNIGCTNSSVKERNGNNHTKNIKSGDDRSIGGEDRNNQLKKRAALLRMRARRLKAKNQLKSAALLTRVERLRNRKPSGSSTPALAPNGAHKKPKPNAAIRRTRPSSAVRKGDVKQTAAFQNSDTLGRPTTQMAYETSRAANLSSFNLVNQLDQQTESSDDEQFVFSTYETDSSDTEVTAAPSSFVSTDNGNLNTDSSTRKYPMRTRLLLRS